MAIKCNECGLWHQATPIKDEQGNVKGYKRRYAKFPLYEDMPDGKKRWMPFNLFKFDVVTLIFMIAIVIMFITYNHDLQAFKDNLKQIQDNSCEICELQKSDDFVLNQSKILFVNQYQK